MKKRNVTEKNKMQVAFRKRSLSPHQIGKVFLSFPLFHLFKSNPQLLSSHSPFSLSNSLLLFLPFPPDPFSLSSALNACARSRCLPLGLQLHSLSLRTPHYSSSLLLRNSLLLLYSSCSLLPSALRLFDEMPLLRDSVSWSTLLRTPSLPAPSVSSLFNRMLSGSFSPNTAALLSFLSASPSSPSAAHAYCIRTGHSSHLKVNTAIVKMYVTSGRLHYANKAFDEVPRRERDTVAYNCMADGYAKAGRVDECLDLLRTMRRDGVRPNATTFVALASACGCARALAAGREVVRTVDEEGLHIGAALGTAILDMYVKCGCIDEAVRVFRRMAERDVRAWTAMIMGLGVHGRARDALAAFREMDVAPNEVTFLAVLNACSHGGMVEAGRDCFERMVREYGMTPGVEHYGCVVDLLGRAGLLEEAYLLLKSLPTKGDATAWRALLAACRVYGDVRHAELARRALVDLGDEHPTDSILLSSAYVASGRRMEMDSEGGEGMERKEVGCSSIEVNG